MAKLDRALEDISSIRSQMAAGTRFRGFGPAVLAATGCLALVTALAQSLWMPPFAEDPVTFFAGWVATAIACVALIGVEMVARTRRHHAGLADAMAKNAAGQFLPAGVAGAAIGCVLLKFAPESLWMLPGLWQVLIALGIFASLRSLPRSVAVAGAWYLIAGIGVLVMASSSHSLSPWMMGVPFALGQFLMAALLHLAAGEQDAEA